MRDTDAAWLAGFIDGEGSFMIKRAIKDGYYFWFAEICVSSTTPEAVEKCKAICGGKITNWLRPSVRNKPAAIWYLGGTSLAPVIKAMLPYLVVKRQQAALVLLLRGEIKRGSQRGNSGVKSDPARNARRELMRLAMKALNHRGCTPIPMDRLAALESLLPEIRRIEESHRTEFVPAPVLPSKLVQGS